MGIHLPGRLRNADIALVVQLQVYLLVIGIFVGDDGLLVAASCDVSVREVPHSLTIRLVVGEATLIVGAIIREDPLSLDELVISPLSNQLVPSIVVDIRA